MMMLKTLFGIVLIFFHANITPVEGVASELTHEEQKKLLETLDHDRKEIAHQLKIPFEDIKYDLNLEIQASSPSACDDDFPRKTNHLPLPLRWNNVADDLLKALGQMILEKTGQKVDISKILSMILFDPKLTKIGCSKTTKCTEKLPENFDEFPEFGGKTIETNGICVINSNFGEGTDDLKKLGSVKVPTISKYADIIGVKPVPGSKGEAAALESSSGRGAFNVILAALFLVFFV